MKQVNIIIIILVHCIWAFFFLASRPLQSMQPRTEKSAEIKAEESRTADSDAGVILAAMFCSLICVIGLALVARCAFGRAFRSPPQPSIRGLKKKALQSLPRALFHADRAQQEERCPICLAEFVQGDEVRILPECGHGFHLRCVDTWLGCHSSCPFCRRIVTIAAPPPREEPGRLLP